VIIADASAAVLALIGDGAARRLLQEEDVAAPHLIDSEVAQALRSLVARNEIVDDDGARALTTWSRLGVRRFSAVGFLPRVWELRHNVSSYDATYVALAEALGGALLTADARLGRAEGPECTMLLVKD